MKLLPNGQDLEDNELTKLEKEYEDLYGNIPKDDLARFNLLLDDKFKRCRQSLQSEIQRISRIGWIHESFTIFLLPKATPRPRLGINGTFYVKGASDNKKFFYKYMKDKDIPLITTPTKFTCRCYLPIPKSMNPVEKVLAELGFIYPISKPDCDNLAKAYCDMIQGTLIYDDAIVVRMVAEKFYSVKPRIEIDLYYMQDYDCKYNKKKIEKG